MAIYCSIHMAGLTFDACIMQFSLMVVALAALPPNLDYPLELDKVAVKEMTGTKTDFTGSFVEYAIVDFDFDAPEDVDNMQDIRELAAKYGKNRVWVLF